MGNICCCCKSYNQQPDAEAAILEISATELHGETKEEIETVTSRVSTQSDNKNNTDDHKSDKDVEMLINDSTEAIRTFNDVSFTLSTECISKVMASEFATSNKKKINTEMLTNLSNLKRSKEIIKQFQKLVIESDTAKIITKNSEILNKLLSEIDYIIIKEPYIGKIYTLECLSSNDSEYLNISNFFISTNRRSFTIQNIEKVHNPYLLMHYSLKGAEFRAIMRERILFHGTKKSNVDGICTNNFNWRLHGTALGSKFGSGVCFTTNAYYATHYGDSTANKVMFAAKVLVGRSCLGDKNQVVPPHGYDATTNNTGQVIVKYEDHTFYPAYVISYYNCK